LFWTGFDSIITMTEAPPFDSINITSLKVFFLL
jgi:hypothetical protein